MTHPHSVFCELMKTIEQRKQNPTEQSYTAKLMAGGIDAIGVKIVEEAGELVEAAGQVDDDFREHLIHEAADLFYHLFVLLTYRNISLGDVETELARRFGISGLDEKASRTR